MTPTGSRSLDRLPEMCLYDPFFRDGQKKKKKKKGKIGNRNKRCKYMFQHVHLYLFQATVFTMNPSLPYTYLDNLC